MKLQFPPVMFTRRIDVSSESTSPERMAPRWTCAGQAAGSRVNDRFSSELHGIRVNGASQRDQILLPMLVTVMSFLHRVLMSPAHSETP
jgi:hypothetical protein